MLLKDRDLFIIHKPSGMAVYRDGSPNEGESALDVAKQLAHGPIFPVHRLDKPTCGILVFARTPEFSAKLAKLFQSRMVKKKYLAVAWGNFKGSGRITTELKDPKTKKPTPALTVWRSLGSVEREVLGQPEWISLLELTPETGRFHQLRRHLKFEKSPILGDPEYGRTPLDEELSEKVGLSRLMLSSVRLEFPHPNSRKPIRVTTTPDPEFGAVAARLGLKLR